MESIIQSHYLLVFAGSGGALFGVVLLVGVDLGLGQRRQGLNLLLRSPLHPLPELLRVDPIHHSQLVGAALPSHLIHPFQKQRIIMISDRSLLHSKLVKKERQDKTLADEGIEGAAYVVRAVLAVHSNLERHCYGAGAGAGTISLLK